jgi:hypothetical protein
VALHAKFGRAAESRRAELLSQIATARREAELRVEGPSLIGYLMAHRPSQHPSRPMRASRSFILQRLYARGRDFRDDPARFTNYSDPNWLTDYSAYVFYQSVRLLGSIFAILLGMALNAVALQRLLTRLVLVARKHQSPRRDVSARAEEPSKDGSISGRKAYALVETLLWAKISAAQKARWAKQKAGKK